MSEYEGSPRSTRSTRGLKGPRHDLSVLKGGLETPDTARVRRALHPPGRAGEGTEEDAARGGGRDDSDEGSVEFLSETAGIHRAARGTTGAVGGGGGSPRSGRGRTPSKRAGGGNEDSDDDSVDFMSQASVSAPDSLSI